MPNNPLYDGNDVKAIRIAQSVPEGETLKWIKLFGPEAVPLRLAQERASVRYPQFFEMIVTFDVDVGSAFRCVGTELDTL